MHKHKECTNSSFPSHHPLVSWWLSPVVTEKQSLSPDLELTSLGHVLDAFERFILLTIHVQPIHFQSWWRREKHQEFIRLMCYWNRTNTRVNYLAWWWRALLEMFQLKPLQRFQQEIPKAPKALFAPSLVLPLHSVSHCKTYFHKCVNPWWNLKN